MAKMGGVENASNVLKSSVCDYADLYHKYSAYFGKRSSMHKTRAPYGYGKDRLDH